MAGHACLPASLADIVSTQGVGVLVFTRLPVLDRVRMRGLSRGFRAAVDDSLTLLTEQTRLSGNEMADVQHQHSWLQGLLWLISRCPNLRTFAAGGLPPVKFAPSECKGWDDCGYIARPRARRAVDVDRDDDDDGDGDGDKVGDEGREVEEVGGGGEKETGQGGRVRMKAECEEGNEDEEVGKKGVEEDEEEGEEEEEAFPQIAHIWWTPDATHQVLQRLADKCLNLRHLDLEGCAGAVSDETLIGLVPRVPYLQRLKLLTGTKVTDASMHALAGHCPQLRHLSLRNPCTTRKFEMIVVRRQSIRDAGVRAIAERCLRLQTLCVPFCFGVTNASIVAVVENCPLLSTLDVSCTGVRYAGLYAVVLHCPMLQSLVCKGGDVGDTSVGAYVHPRLRELLPRWPLFAATSRAAAATMTPPDRSCRSQLRHLDLQAFRGLSNTSLGALLRHCPSLASLVVSETGITSASIIAEYCPRLRHLDVSDTGVTDDGISAVAARCNGLRGLRLRACRISNAALCDFARRCPGLHTLDVAGCRTVGNASVKSFNQLRWVDVAGSGVGDRGCAWLLKNCRHLRHLAIGNGDASAGAPALTDAAVAVYPVAAGSSQGPGVLRCGAVCQGLDYLEIVKCAQITDAGVGALLARCPRLRTLILVGCAGVTDACMAAVAACCPRLRQMDLKGCNRVTDAGLKAVAEGCLQLHFCCEPGETFFWGSCGKARAGNQSVS
eukprot:jgi/Mesvir1/15060/Mv14710-RA.1